MRPGTKKILIVRFSSIGDIVLTTPVIRCVKEQLEGVEVHFLTKSTFRSILESNPYVDKIYAIQKEIDEVLPDLKKEAYDLIIDLHNNLRTWRLGWQLGVPINRFNKINRQKWMMVNFKWNQLPSKHIVDRYLDAARSLGVENDDKGLDYFISEKDDSVAKDYLSTIFPNQESFIAIVIGAAHATKCLPKEKLAAICHKIQQPVLLLGGPGDVDKGDWIVQNTSLNVTNTSGQFNINQSAALIKYADLVVTHDTGLMHIAAAFNKKIISVWGNTIPEFGMYPYFPAQHSEDHHMVEVKELSCRPCSKIGFASCPKKHFNCMNEIKIESILEKI